MGGHGREARFKLLPRHRDLLLLGYADQNERALEPLARALRGCADDFLFVLLERVVGDSARLVFPDDLGHDAARLGADHALRQLAFHLRKQVRHDLVFRVAIGLDFLPLLEIGLQQFAQIRERFALGHLAREFVVQLRQRLLLHTPDRDGVVDFLPRHFREHKIGRHPDLELDRIPRFCADQFLREAGEERLGGHAQPEVRAGGERFAGFFINFLHQFAVDRAGVINHRVVFHLQTAIRHFGKIGGAFAQAFEHLGDFLPADRHRLRLDRDPLVFRHLEFRRGDDGRGVTDFPVVAEFHVLDVFDGEHTQFFFRDRLADALRHYLLLHFLADFLPEFHLHHVARRASGPEAGQLGV